MEKSKILIVFTKYKQFGGEESVIANELEHLNKTYNTKYIEFNNKNPLNLIISSFNIFIFIKMIYQIFITKPEIIYINNLWFGGSNAVLYASFLFKNLKIYFKIHNYRITCSKGTHFLNNNICEQCDSSNKLSSYKNKCYRNSYIQTLFINIFSKVQLNALKKDRIAKIFILNNLQKEKFINAGIKPEKLSLSKNILNIKKAGITKKEDSSKTFCFIGRLEPEKGILDLIKVWDQFTKTNFNLNIIGSGSCVDIIESYARKTNNVTYRSEISNKEVSEVLAKSRALIHPSKWYEGQPTIILEAMLNNTPVLSSDISFIETFDKHNEIDTFKSGNSLELSKLIEIYMDEKGFDIQKRKWEDFSINFFNKKDYQINF